MTKKEKFDKYFMGVARLTSENSYARRAKVGAILVKDGRIVASGWNGQPTGFPNECEQEITNSDGSVELTTLPTVIHSEANLLTYCAKYGIPTDGAELYVTLSPCVKCALLIVQAGIKSVYYNEAYRDISGIELLCKSGVNVSQIKI